MQKGIVEAYAGLDLSVSIVWVPMIASDNEAAARRASRMFADTRVAQFYDPQLRVGRACMTDVFPNCIQDALSVLPVDDWLYVKLSEWAKKPMTHPLWDAALFYKAGAQWQSSVPRPDAWAKQVGFYGPDAENGITGRFWRDDCKTLPVESDWLVQIKVAMERISGPRQRK